MTDYISLLSLSSSSRNQDHLFSISQQGRKAITWNRFTRELEFLRSKIASSPNDRWSLFAEDHSLFILGLFALLQCGKEVHLPHTAPIIPVSSPEADAPLLSDSVENATLKLCFSEESFSETAPQDFPLLDAGKILITFHTSGSTGKPKQVPKTFIQIENELKNLAKLWSNDYHNATVYSTVSPQHYYGFLFTALLPFCLGSSIAPMRVHYPESLTHVGKQNTVLVTSPAFLKRLSDKNSLPLLKKSPRKVFSSGGFLPDFSAVQSRAYLGTDVFEIYGSTETGGIAWRISPGNLSWTPFPGIKIKSPDGIHLALSSPYLSESGFLTIDDRVEILDDGTLRLFGRTDSIVKIEEKRVALNDVENRIIQTGLVEDVIVLALEKGRQFLAAAVVLNRKGSIKFKGKQKKDLNDFFRYFLRPYFELTVIPKKWRFLESIPRNTQGKININIIKELFNKEASAYCLEPVILDSKQKIDRILLTLSFPEDYIHFQGHFPEMKILPAVAQVDWVMKFLQKKSGLNIAMQKIPLFKLLKPIFPDTPVNLDIHLNLDNKQIKFSYKNPQDGTAYSQGKIIFKETT
ncbi:MAG: AMP-binding protein [Spirochaetales bacterium]|nr:AMP-binding protein [Spirochaetales bacterium]